MELREGVSALTCQAPLSEGENEIFFNDLTIYMHKKAVFCCPSFMFKGERTNSVCGSVVGRVRGCSGPCGEENDEAGLV